MNHGAGAAFHFPNDQKPPLMNPHMFVNSRPSSVVSLPPGTPHMPPQQGPPMMFALNNLHALNMNFVGNSNERITHWFPWNNLGTNLGPMPPSEIMSQITNCQSRMSIISQSPKVYKSEKESIGPGDIDYMIDLLSEDFDIREKDITQEVLRIINQLKMIDQESSNKIMEALWKALAHIDCTQLVENPATKNERIEMLHILVLQFYDISKRLPHSVDSRTIEEKQRVIKALLVLLQSKPDDHVFQLIDGLSSNSPECRQILCARSNGENDPINSLLTMQAVCRKLRTFQFGQNSPRTLLCIIRLILTLISHRDESSNLDDRVEIRDCFVNEGLEPVLNFFDQCIQNSTNIGVPPAIRHYKELYDRLIRNISRLIQFLSDSPKYVMALINMKIFERSIAVQNITHLSKTGVETRQNLIKTYANLSCCMEKLQNLNLNDVADLTLDFIRKTYNYNDEQRISFDIRNLHDVVVYGTGFLANLVYYNPFLKEHFTRNSQAIQFIIKICQDCSTILEKCQSNLVKSLTETVEHCIKILCFLNDRLNPLANEATQILFNSSQVLIFTYLALFRPGNFKRLGGGLRIFVLNMWDRGLTNNYCPPIPQDPQSVELSMFLLEFFTDNIEQPERVFQQIYPEIELTIKILQKLIENQTPYATLIENRLCIFNSKWMPFQMLNRLESVAAAYLMLDFLCTCSKFDRLKQLWSADSQNQQILNKFSGSSDSRIQASSFLLLQQLFIPSEYNLMDAFLPNTY